MENRLTPNQRLAATVEALERKKRKAREDISSELHQLKEALTPGNLIKSTVQNVMEDPSKRKKLLLGGLGATAMFFANKFIGKKTMSVAKFLVPTLISLVKKQKKSNGVFERTRRTAS